MDSVGDFLELAHAVHGGDQGGVAGALGVVVIDGGLHVLHQIQDSQVAGALALDGGLHPQVGHVGLVIVVHYGVAGGLQGGGHTADVGIVILVEAGNIHLHAGIGEGQGGLGVLHQDHGLQVELLGQSLHLGGHLVNGGHALLQVAVRIIQVAALHLGLQAVDGGPLQVLAGQIALLQSLSNERRLNLHAAHHTGGTEHAGVAAGLHEQDGLLIAGQILHAVGVALADGVGVDEAVKAQDLTEQILQHVLVEGVAVAIQADVVGLAVIGDGLGGDALVDDGLGVTGHHASGAGLKGSDEGLELIVS